MPPFHSRSAGKKAPHLGTVASANRFPSCAHSIDGLGAPTGVVGLGRDDSKVLCAHVLGSAAIDYPAGARRVFTAARYDF